ncbi:ATP-binding protein [Allorhizobium sp. BGMRC 0089]|uniref:hybrid sensor histidine kinase/response regulator n=1 Tax=Allorhizobium sonneratiae TaxID=2934936 RepID=UPI00203403A9|nr:ATP-binding protein [Allorhizobium sonneratiae]MCM2291010.1 ATP-binding protein [Allorhizobium sonneratiae]
MAARQRIIPVRRQYNRWVADQTLEDYALRFTAKSARRFSSSRISQTAIGAISFLALEAIGGAITLSYGTVNAFFAILTAAILMLLIGLPISRYAIREGVDIDLLTRGAGFGYIGSTVTSLIYASFTFMLFAIEASIMTGALELAFSLPPAIGYIVSAVVVIPLVTYGVRLISRFQLLTQPVWIVLNIAPFLFIALTDWSKFDLWRAFPGLISGQTAAFRLADFGGACAVILALMPQIGEQVDFLRFLPPEGAQKKRHRLAVFLAGSGWVALGVPKLLAGSFLAVLTLSEGVAIERAADPAHMYLTAFSYIAPGPVMPLVLMVAFVMVSQLKINVMNAYAGSLAWSNFFSRLTHSHPGRVVWLVFNVAIALLLMELGIYRLLEETLGIFSIIAMAWLCTISADLFINKRLGLSPPGIEFKRAHLYDVNPVGCGTLVLSSGLAIAAHAGLFGASLTALSTFVTLSAFVIAPALAAATKGRYYLARKPRHSWKNLNAITCSICEHPFEPEDMAWCPAYAAPICSLCCSLDSRCHDMCKPHAALNSQVATVARHLLPDRLTDALASRLGRYGLTSLAAVSLIGLVLGLIAHQVAAVKPETSTAVNGAILIVFFVFSITACIAAWFYVLAHDSRVVAEEESSRQNSLLLKEIAAHKKTDAALQAAKEAAEAANRAKSRYVVGLTHELRTPLNAVLGYAQLLEHDETIPAPRQAAIKVIRRSADHLSGLIDGLLDISKIEAGRLQVFPAELALADFLDQIVAMIRPQAEAKGLRFLHERPENLPHYVRTDERRLRQILVNILSNAVKFTDEGSVSFTLTYRSQVASFTIADTGRGIAEKDLTRIFEPFQRGEADSIRPLPGLGLGLTITRLLTNTLGGDIAVTSEKGKGTVFRVRLMLSTVDRPSTAPTPERRIAGYDGPRRTLVVVDDNEDHRDLMREALTPLDFIVLTAASGPECLTLIEGVEPDLFLVDISMPVMNGWQLVERLRNLGQSAPILMLSANLGDGAVREPGSSGHNDAIAKPVDVKVLRDKLARHLKLVWRYADEAPPPPPAPPGLVIPPAADLADLKGLAEIGYIRGIDSKLAGLARDPAYLAFTEMLRPYIQSFDMAGLIQKLHTVMGDRADNG